ncbi:glycine n-acyltransferase [Plakobranchus ocellatus]|uniref:Glycine N-acyltransferase-like protein n=1 Tax=Plakobranchus ocellatus TaxID=259542 RepID=A0AAV4BXQ1_9GAST|nr:glycine n-acyltransferase [Plakobranchus ocellatus]
MFHVLSQEETEELHKELGSQLPESAKMYCNISNHLNELLTGFEVIVDQWPCWTCIMLRPNCPELVPHYFRNYHICHSRSIKDFKFFIQRPGVVDWSKPAVFTGIPYDAVSVIQEKSRKEYGQVTSVENRFMYCWNKKDLPEPEKISDGLKLTSLTSEHADILCSQWKHDRKNDGLLEYFQRVIDNFESSAVMDSDGRLIAYICMQFNGSMANLYVDPDYRASNLGVALLRDLTGKLLSKGHTAYGFIKTKDATFISTCQKIGFTWIPQGSMSWLHYRPKSLTANRSWPEALTSEAKSEKKEDKAKVYFNAMTLSCNDCLPSSGSTDCIHVTSS